MILIRILISQKEFNFSESGMFYENSKKEKRTLILLKQNFDHAHKLRILIKSSIPQTRATDD